VTEAAEIVMRRRLSQRGEDASLVIADCLRSLLEFVVRKKRVSNVDQFSESRVHSAVESFEQKKAMARPSRTVAAAKASATSSVAPGADAAFEEMPPYESPSPDCKLVEALDAAIRASELEGVYVAVERAGERLRVFLTTERPEDLRDAGHSDDDPDELLLG
jgi:hypothetical protein